MNVAFQGEHGAYSEIAALKHFKGKIATVPCATFSEVIESLKNGSQFGILPIENSIEGNVVQTYDLLLKNKVSINAEVIQRISHCLITNPKAKLTQLKEVYSHPQALGQSREYLEKHQLVSIPSYDTAGSVKLIKEKHLQNSGAIASELAAKIYKMDILARGIETDKKNFTRFFVISKYSKKISINSNKTSIAFGTKNVPGALFRVLKVLSDHKINLTYIQSRPIIGRPWEYNFYLDLEGSIKDAKIKNAISEMVKMASFLKVLGSYQGAGAKS